MKIQIPFLLLFGMLLTACGPLPEFQSDFSSSWWEVKQEKLNIYNDFSDLDRSLVSRPLNYQECAARSGAKLHQKDRGDRVYATCDHPHFSGQQFTFVRNKQASSPLISWSFAPQDQTYSLDGNVNGLLTQIFREYPLPVAEQNSLIELFALTGVQKSYQKPDIPYFNPELLRSWREIKPSITLSWELKKHFKVRWTKDGLHMQKLSQWKDEPELNLTFPDGEVLSVGSLRAPDELKEEGFYGGSYQTTTTKLINEQLKKYSWVEVELELSSDKVNYSQSGEFLGHEKEVYFTLRFDKLAYEDFGFEPSLCFQSNCFDPKLPIQHYKNRYYQRQSFPEKEEEYHFLYNSQQRLFLKRESQYGEGKFSWEQLGAVHFKGSSESFCSPTTLKQQILQGKEKLNFPQELIFFGEKYQLQDLDFEINYGLDARNDFGFTKKYEQLFVNAEEAEKVISEDIQKDLLIYGNYIFSFADAPQVKLHYSNLRFPQNPQALYFSKAELQLNQSGDLISLPQTRQLYCDLRLEDRNQTICGKREREEPKTLEGAMIFEEEKEKRMDRSSAKNSREREMLFTPALLPLFRLQKTNVLHYYFIFPAEWVRFTNGGYGCKPVIYAYDQRKRTNQLTISLPAGSRFTKLIPEFTSGTTWDFRTDEASRISVGNQTFPYLYYSTWRNQYENNPQGRTVAYEDLSAFFHAKLDAMHFNQQEKADFLDYWLPEFEPGFVYTISFKINEDFEPYAQLSFLHQPEKIFRVFMEAHQHPLTKHISFDPSYPNAGNEKFLKVFERGSSFDVLERGGKLEKWRAK